MKAAARAWMPGASLSRGPPMASVRSAAESPRLHAQPERRVLSDVRLAEGSTTSSGLR